MHTGCLPNSADRCTATSEGMSCLRGSPILRKRLRTKAVRANNALQLTAYSLVSLRGDVGASPSRSPPDVRDRFSLGTLRPERSVGRHVLDSQSPYSCLVPL